MQTSLEHAVVGGEAIEAELKEMRKEGAAREAEVQRLEVNLAKQTDYLEAVVKDAASVMRKRLEADTNTATQEGALRQMSIIICNSDALKTCVARWHHRTWQSMSLMSVELVEVHC